MMMRHWIFYSRMYLFLCAYVGVCVTRKKKPRFALNSTFHMLYIAFNISIKVRFNDSSAPKEREYLLIYRKWIQQVVKVYDIAISS